jgi:membrane-bound ClpP family serine protease
MATLGIILVVIGAALMVAEAHLPSMACWVPVPRRH